MLRSFLKTFQEIVYVDNFSSSTGLLQSVDPRVKLCCITAFILSAVSLRTVTPLVILIAVVLTLSLASKIPVRFFILRATIFVPIIAGMIAVPLPFITPGTGLAKVGFLEFSTQITWEGILRAVQFTLRVWVCVASVILLVMTTKFSKLAQAMEKMKFPRVLVAMTTITYRFIFLFINEAYRMTLAKESRTVTRPRWRERVGSLANLVATLFMRAYERGERVYLAMMARGYSGTAKSLGQMRFSRRDWIFACISLLTCVIIISTEYLHLGGQ